ncbi:signal peptidase II [Bisgaardia hudsonensis]|uniref:Lipoprotein signal peptidase n=1 Tax=Bisgaardia hudsonensis TaxID=109472 RepID=A0A4R2MXG1_9PAST|nr:signal peptidase II [Bisgaardia hudsonensis]QLB12302.1 signal peptidase II [Bisgaardia hudsonensis]TCP12347.1 signal peptidase II [Bisgaardia hudsonensis]
MINTKSKTGLAFLWLSAVVFCVDLATKYLVIKNFALYDSISILPVFNLTYVRNYGAAFSFLADHSGWQKLFFITLAIVISGVLIYFLYQNTKCKLLQNAAYSLIIGGALGNAMDRAYNGFVIDFFDFYWRDWHYPVFNVADIGITIGAMLLIIDSFKSKNDK